MAAFEANLQATCLLSLYYDNGISPFSFCNPVMCSYEISQSLQRFNAPVNTIKMSSQATGLCICMIESHKSPCNIPVNLNYSKQFVIGIFMAQSYAVEIAEAD